MDLDNILNVGFQQVVQNSGQQTAQIVARRHLDNRRQCRANEACIEKVQRVAIKRLIALGAKVSLPPNASAQTAAAKEPEVPKPPQVVYFKQDEANYVLDSIRQFATESPSELTVDFVINFDRLRQASTGVWSDRKAQQFEAVLTEIDAMPALAERISSARASFAREQTERQARAIATLDEKLSALKTWVLNNAISEYAPDIAQFLKRGEEVLSRDNYEEILLTTERADQFLVLIAPKEPAQTAAVETQAAAAALAEDTVNNPEIRVTFAFLEAQSTMGDAFEQYLAPKGQILLPVRLVFRPGQDAALLTPSQLDIEIGIETGARYPVNVPATLALAAQLGIPPAIDMPAWALGEQILLVFEIPRLNAVPKTVYIRSDGFEFKPIRE